MIETRPPRLARVAVLDRHAVFRLGAETFLRGQAGMEPVGSAADSGDLWPMLRRVDPDVLLVDHHAGRSDRLALCLRIRAAFRARVVLLTTDAEPHLALGAELAGADALVDKAEPAATLAAAIRAVAGGARALPAVTAGVQATAAGRLSPQDRAVLAMRLAGTSHRDIAAVCGIASHEVDARVAQVIVDLFEPPGVAGLDRVGVAA